MLWLWLGFIAFVLMMLTLDLAVFHRKEHAVSLRESLLWVAFYVALSLSFAVLVYWLYSRGVVGGDDINGQALTGTRAALLYLTGYIVELSLSMDNMFVIAMIMTYFAVPAQYQHRLLFWGIMGALVMRGVMILAGVALVQKFDWVLYVFGAFLIYSAYRMLFGKEEADPHNNFIVRQARKLLPVTTMQGRKFLGRIDGRLAFTPMALALIAIESADVIFAVDSIPAIFAITQESFLIFTSNIFAILGLRSLYFALAGVIDKFRYLKVSLSVLLAVIGLKMLLKEVLHDIPGLMYYTLALVVLILAGGIVASVLIAKHKEHPPQEPGQAS